MSFSADWLSLRAGFDSAARNTDLERRLASWGARRGAGRALRIVDLGAGSGNNKAHLSPRLSIAQDWTLVDSDPALLAEARRTHPDARIVAGDLAGDLAGELGSLIPEGTDLVTASALIDLVSRPWLERLVERVLRVGCALLIVLTYDGRITWEAETAEDRDLTELVNRHQRGDKGFGPALGPDAPDVLSRLVPSIERAESDWVVRPGDTDMRGALVTGWAGAAAEISPENAEKIETWRQFATAKPRLLKVGHTDQILLPND